MPDHPVPFSARSAIRLRRARAADRPFAEALYFGTMLPLLSRLGFGDPVALRSRFDRGWSSKRSRIVRSAATDIGWMQVSPWATGLHLDQLHLVANWRDRGIGSVLIARLLARAGRMGAEVGLDVIHGNPAMALYRRFGFGVVETDHEKSRMVWRPPPPDGR